MLYRFAHCSKNKKKFSDFIFQNMCQNGLWSFEIDKKSCFIDKIDEIDEIFVMDEIDKIDKTMRQN